ncbi:PH domain-containing protein [Streptomyces sp. CC219B]|uniref:PH domain-containing protein n=1 Tax=Streptomyces sp. CC219B TaxID=3044574 RepID=UPI0024A893E7|nr:PH domain-containing protein [Streptomyces sp. CC219B]
MGTKQQKRRQARRAARLAREQRLAELRPSVPPAPEPLTVGAGWSARSLAVALVAAYLLGNVEPDRDMSAGRWFFLALGASAWAFTVGRLAAWRIVADADGVLLRSFLQVRRLPWDDIRDVWLRRDGLLEFSAGTDEPVRVGGFVPPLLHRRLRIPTTGRRTADLLALMARHPELRPTHGAEAGPPTVMWSLGAVGLLLVDWFLVG